MNSFARASGRSEADFPDGAEGLTRIYNGFFKRATVKLYGKADTLQIKSFEKCAIEPFGYYDFKGNTEDCFYAHVYGRITCKSKETENQLGFLLDANKTYVWDGDANEFISVKEHVKRIEELKKTMKVGGRLCCLVTEYKKGEPAQALRIEERNALPLGPSDARVRMLITPINPANINVLEGTYMSLPKELPSIAGDEGIGVVTELGEEAARDETIKVGDRVFAPGRFKSGAWSTECVEPAKALLSVPEGADDVMASMLATNPPTAYAMLLHNGLGEPPLSAGDWVIHNAANSGVGVAVIQVARSLGLKTVNVVRSEVASAMIQPLSPDVTIVFDEDGDINKAAEEIKQATSGASLRLALNGVGGDSSKLLLKCLAASGTLLTYGNMSRKPMEAGGGQLIFKDLRLRGFHLSRALSSMSKAEVDAMWECLVKLAGEGLKTVASVDAIYPLSRAAEAVEYAFAHSIGKVLLRCSDCSFLAGAVMDT